MKSSQFSKALKRNSWGGREKKKKKASNPPTAQTQIKCPVPRASTTGFGDAAAPGEPHPAGRLRVWQSRTALLGQGWGCAQGSVAPGRKHAWDERRHVRRLPHQGPGFLHGTTRSPARGRRGGQRGRPTSPPRGPAAPGGARLGQTQQLGKVVREQRESALGWAACPRPGDRSPRRPAGPGRPLPGLPLLAPLTRQLRRRRTPPAAGPGSGPALPRGSW